MNNNIYKAFKNKNKYFNEVNKGNKLLVKKGTYANGGIIKHKKIENEIKGTIATCLENYSGGLLLIRVDEDQYLFKEGDEFLIDIKYVSSITNEQWNIIKNKNMEKLNKEKVKNKRKELKNIEKNKLHLSRNLIFI